jgi:hypothetical protein
MPDEFNKRAHALEEAFFNKQSNELLEKLRARDVAKQKKSDLTAVTGIEDATVLDELVGLGLDATKLVALTLAPLVLMAWRDGKMGSHERAAVLRAAEDQGFKQGSLIFQMVEGWVEHRPDPSLKHAWVAYVKTLRAKMPPEAYTALKRDILERTKRVAHLTGVLGVIGVTSPGEKALLAEIEAALG